VGEHGWAVTFDMLVESDARGQIIGWCPLHLLQSEAVFALAAFSYGHVAELVGIEGGVVSGVINLESSGA
jgi:hypothetical protein